MKKARRHLDVNLVELDQVLDSALEAPLSEANHNKLKDTLHALAAMLVRSRNTEKTSEVVGKPEDSKQPDDNAQPPSGHGRNGVEAFNGARKVDISASEVDAWRPLPGVRKRQCVRAEGAEGSGARSPVRRRWRLRFTHSSGCAAEPAGRCSQRRSRKEWGRISTMKRLLR
jgi:hypothetical protein